MNRISPPGQWLKASRGFLALVVAPLLVLGAYYLFVASDRYLSQAMISIKRSSASELTAMGGLVSAGLAAPDVRTDAYYLREHILSHDMLDYLDGKFDLHKAYSDPGIDFFSRLWSWRNLGGEPTREEFLDYYRDRVDVRYDDNSSIITIAVQGFTPDFAQEINKAIVKQGEEFINGISRKLANDQLDFVAQELQRSQDRLIEARNKLIAFQNQHQVLDPAEQAKATAGYINAMEAEVAQQEAELKNLLTYVSRDAFQVQSLRSKIEALKQQLDQERARLSGKGSKGKLNEVAARFLNLQSLVDFAVDAYKATLGAMEATRVEASKKLKSVVVIASPSLPDWPEYPRKLYNLGLLAVILLAVYGIGVLIIETIKDHRD